MQPLVSLFHGPKAFLASQASALFVLICACAIFLAFDIRRRDTKNRIHDVLDSKPVSNFDFLLGKSLAISLYIWLAFAVSVLLAVAASMGLEYFVGGIGGSTNWDSLFFLLFVGAWPGSVFWASLLAVCAAEKL